MAIGELFFSVLEILGTVSFAVSGAMAAIEKRVDLFGVIFLGITTSLAGGIIRDVVIGRVPPAAFSDYKYISFSDLDIRTFAKEVNVAPKLAPI